jgi:carboxypeptidase Taq
MNLPAAYAALETRFRRLHAVREATGMLHWDMSVMMPPGGAESRAEQLAVLQVIGHGMATAPELADELESAQAVASDLDPWQRANLGEMRRAWVHANAVPADLVEALSRATSKLEGQWRKARPAADFSLVAAGLAEVLSLVRQVAQAKAGPLGVSPYEALLDEFEPGGRTADIDRIFDDLAGFLPDFIERVMTAQGALPAPARPSGPFPREAQRALGEALMRALGFDFEHGRLDVSLHPFCGGTPDDVRITTRYEDDNFASALMGVIHETGHALYERGLPPAWRHQPVGQARGMSVHESQSLFWEMQVARGRPFLTWLAPRLAETFGGDGAAWAPDNLHRLYTRVRRSFIRVDADEATYPAHVILRYRLEKAMIAGELEVDGLPAAWNEGMRALLGIVPPSDREGCLQDIHWFDGAWGYFPTYTLGAMTAAQLFDAARGAVPDLSARIERGEFAALLAWLRENLHRHGASLPTPALLTKATGRPLDPAVFRKHLEARYLA